MLCYKLSSFSKNLLLKSEQNKKFPFLDRSYFVLVLLRFGHEFGFVLIMLVYLPVLSCFCSDNTDV